MKLKEFGPPGGGAHPKFYYVDPRLFMMNKGITISQIERGLHSFSFGDQILSE